MTTNSGKKGAGQEARPRVAWEDHPGGIADWTEATKKIRGWLEYKRAHPNIELTRVTKRQGSVTKRISPGPNGERVVDPSQCKIVRGTMERLAIYDWQDFAPIIEKTQHNVAYALGALRDGLLNEVPLVTKTDKRAKEPGFAARTQDNILYAERVPSFILLDIDTKGMPGDVRDRVKEQGGILAVLEHLCKGLRFAGFIRRASTSAGIYNKQSGEEYPSGGEHIYLIVDDASDAHRFLYALHDRAWLAGLGWYIVGKAGRLLERAIIDRSVCDAARLVFEANADCVAPFAQRARKATVRDGTPYNTRGMLDNLNHVELQKLKKIKADTGAPLQKEREAARDAWLAERIEKDAAKGMPPEATRRIMEKMLSESILHPSMLLTFDDDDLGMVSAGDVLASPAKFEGETLADPIEGIEYGTCKGIVYVQKNGEVTIHSCAHGLSVLYHLRFDCASIEAAINTAPDLEAVDILCRLSAFSELTPVEETRLIELAASRTGNKTGDIKKMLKGAKGKKRADAADLYKEIDALNMDHSFVVENGKSLVFHEIIDPVLKRLKYARMTPQDFKTAYANMRYGDTTLGVAAYKRPAPPIYGWCCFRSC